MPAHVHPSADSNLLADLRALLEEIRDGQLAGGALYDALDGLETTLTDVDLNTDGIEAALASAFTELSEKLEAGDITGLAMETTLVAAKTAIESLDGKDFATEATLSTLEAKIPDESGTWGYAAGESGTETLTGSKRILGITAVPNAGGGTMTIDGGDTVTIPENHPLDWEPRGNLTDPEVVFTDTAAYIIEFLT